jgi:hypothetical protein
MKKTKQQYRQPFPTTTPNDANKKHKRCEPAAQAMASNIVGGMNADMYCVSRQVLVQQACRATIF